MSARIRRLVHVAASLLPAGLMVFAALTGGAKRWWPRPTPRHQAPASTAAAG